MPSQLKQADIWYDQILGNVEEAIHVVDCDGITVYYNRAASEMDGLNAEEVVGRHVLQVYPSLTPETSSLLRVLASKIPVLNQQQTIVTRTGKMVTILYSTYPLYRNGCIVGACDMCRDITKIKELAEQVTELQAELLDVRSAGRQKAKEKKAGCSAQYTFNDIVGSHESIVKLKVVGQRVAETCSPVLILGETGVGKELLVQAIHNASPRKNGPFVAQNCAAFPTTLLESILFGTVKGGFTGAEDRPGLFELADGGTLFLDEMNSMPLELQSKLLRVLQDGTLRRIGDSGLRQVNTRVIACTNVEPEEAVRNKELRVDLYYRLNVVSLKIPPLRERKSDIPALISHFINVYNIRLDRRVAAVSDEVRRIFMEHHWPGNVRELQYAIEHAMNMVSGQGIETEHLPERLQGAGAVKPVPSRSVDIEVSGFNSLPEILRAVEKKALVEAMDKCRGNVSRAAVYLGIPRQTIQYKMKIHGLLTSDSAREGKWFEQTSSGAGPNCLRT
ncbi:MAG: sigma 54-interacting transcriptional regulator [Negativicutes bacterium]|nr:sigma 54-interacting transcriptional regulator [Negativicutes bacterium]